MLSTKRYVPTQRDLKAIDGQRWVTSLRSGGGFIEQLLSRSCLMSSRYRLGAGTERPPDHGAALGFALTRSPLIDSRSYAPLHELGPRAADPHELLSQPFISRPWPGLNGLPTPSATSAATRGLGSFTTSVSVREEREELAVRLERVRAELPTPPSFRDAPRTRGRPRRQVGIFAQHWKAASRSFDRTMSPSPSGESWSRPRLSEPAFT